MRHALLGPSGGGEFFEVGVFAGIHGDEEAGPLAVVEVARQIERNPDLARGYLLSLYPVCNPSGCEAGTRANHAGRDLNREFWRGSDQAEVRWLEAELTVRSFGGLISLHADDTSSGVYGYAHGAVITEHLLRPALAAAGRHLPLDRRPLIDGFPAREGIIRDGFDGILRAPPWVKPRPFEIILETPQHAPRDRQVAALADGVLAILAEHRRLAAYALNL